MPIQVRHVLAAAALLAACGGRYSSLPGDDDANGGSGTGSGGSSQGGKKPGGGKAGATAVGGNSAVGGSGTAGAVSTAGSASCMCADQDCAPGYMQQPDPNGSCCPICVPLNCRNVGCPGIACGSGSQLIYPPDQCCPTCGPSDCNEQRRGYFDFRSQLIEKYNSLGCMQDSDCTVLYEGNSCSFGCGTPIPWFYEKELIVALESYAAMACSSCVPQPVPPCEPQPPPACVQGRCQPRPFR